MSIDKKVVEQTNNIKVIDVRTQSIRKTKGILDVALNGTENIGEVHFNILKKTDIIQKLKFWVIFLYMRSWLRMKSVKHYALGVIHKSSDTEILVPLQRNVLIYANTVTFRSSDSRVRTFLKYIVTLALGWLTWNHDMRIVVSLKKKEQSDDSNLGVNTNNNRFLSFVTPDREISLVFMGNRRRPHLVRKCGRLKSIKQEYQNHLAMRRALGDRVPAILGFENRHGYGCLFMEYVKERTLINIVASKYVKKLDAFVAEVIKHLEFCYEVYRNFMKYVPIVRKKICEEEKQEIFDVVQTLSECSSCEAILQDVVLQIEGMRIPRIIQHNDFCVRNILIRKNRSRVLIDWEDMKEDGWPLADYMMLWMSFEEAYAELFRSSSRGFGEVEGIKEQMKIFDSRFKDLLGADEAIFKIYKIISQISLYKQNVSKGRYRTANMIRERILREALFYGNDIR